MSEHAWTLVILLVAFGLVVGMDRTFMAFKLSK